jgi:hypothetical protein
MTFESPGWPLQNMPQPDTQRKPAFTLKKSCLANWDLNILDSGTTAGANSTSNLQGLLTPETPNNTTDFGYTGVLEGNLASHAVERDGCSASEPPFPQ